MRYLQGEVVYYDDSVIKGQGEIVGLANQRDGGTTVWIIKDLSRNVPNATYPYSTFNMMGSYLGRELSPEMKKLRKEFVAAGRAMLESKGLLEKENK